MVYLHALWSHWPGRSRRALNTNRDPGRTLFIGADQFNLWIKNMELEISDKHSNERQAAKASDDIMMLVEWKHRLQPV